MIQVNELRIGSWVQTQKLYAIIEGISSSGDIDIAVEGYGKPGHKTGIGSINPVKLTEDVLFSCGFRSIGFYDDVYYLDNFRIYLNKKSKAGLLRLVPEGDQPEIEIKSVHQLQNVYFALTGKELEISLENP